MNIENIQKVLLECYSKNLCYPKVQDDWSEFNKCFGMCAITSLIIHDYFGGDICKIHVDGIGHYFNLIDNKIIDLTSSQFNHEIDYKDYQIIDRQKILTNDTKNRYDTLKSRLIKALLKQVDEKKLICYSIPKKGRYIMEKMTSKVALSLLYRDVIENLSELELDKNRWVKHSLYVGIAAGRIADAINKNSNHYAYFKKYIEENGPLDVDYAIALGYIHDIGRKINHPLHTTEGYQYLCDLGYNEEARITLTHSFIDNDINHSADAVTGEDRYQFIDHYLHSIDLTPYDNIIQLCDLFCLETGFTTVERRLLDLTKRKKVYENSLVHFHKTMELLRRFVADDDQKSMTKASDENEDFMSFYALFPEINQEVLDQRTTDREMILNIIYHNMPEETQGLSRKK